MKFSLFTMYATTIVISAAIVAISTSAQEVSSEKSKSTRPEDDYFLEGDIVQYPLKPPDTSSPRTTLQSFVDNMNRAYRVLGVRKNIHTPGLFTSESVQQMTRHAEELFERSVYCLDLSEVPEALKDDAGYEGALKLKEIFDRIELPPFHEIPDAQAIETEQEQEKISEFAHWRIPNTDIVIARSEEGLHQGAYLFTPQTVARLDEFYEKVYDLPYKTNAFISHDFLNTTLPL
jgi:MscS family membrane protein